ncbi:hypothetical protein [Pararhizobium qamdonense]|uniref:hypothetical protein n=1 Tax=Pararhizobium qamdonense TaxID=3031126 RepID=UPI0023E30F1F|nr:hypothetical protein [Pararhizobium qamdonense]
MGGIVSFETNPHHKRLPLVVLTSKGKKTYNDELTLYGPLVEQLADGLDIADIGAARRVLDALRAKLER